MNLKNKVQNFFFKLFIFNRFVYIDVPVGSCAYITSNDRYIFYLVTKEKYYYKPTMSSLESSLRTMRDLCIKNHIHHLAMPRIGCGLDKLNWDQVSRLIQRVFADDDIKITIYTFD
jgi:O-acetyl-ADP-ribose deacetylase (regulator of RNase III)